MGVYTGLYRNSWLSRFFLTFSLIGVSLPTFLIGILLILSSPSGSAGCPPSGAARR
jgi:peptide/nickel transport system permease protein